MGGSVRSFGIKAIRGVCMKIRTARRIRDLLLVVGFIVILTGYAAGPFNGWFGAVIMISSLIPQILYNKCPHCGGQLGRNNGKFCQHCGGEID